MILAAILAALLTQSAPEPSPTPMSDAAIERECRAYYPKATCSEALGAWLPRNGDSFDPSNANRATRGVAADVFVVHGRSLESNSLQRGTFFVYGSAGPPKGTALYDAARHTVLYSQGCCSWHEAVLSLAPTPPPVPLQADDLADVHTRRGARLGMAPADIVRLYGPAREYDVKQHPEMTMLSYTSRRLIKHHNEECGNDENFTFRHGRLIAIQLGWAC